MRKLSPGWVLPGVVAMALLATACSGPSRPNPAPTHTFSAQIKAGQTGTYKLGDLTVTVPAGAVPRDTQLIAARPETTGPLASPLGLPSVSFDLSLANDAEPAKPLEVSIPLKGAYLLNGAKPAQALLYTTTQAKRRGWDLVPSTVDANGVLHAQLSHLSLKAISYVSDQTLMQMAAIDGAPDSLGARPDCQTSVNTPDGQVQFTGANQGWSNKPGSPISACLGTSDGKIKLSVRNQLNYILQAAATDGLNLQDATDTANDALVALLAKRIFPDKRVQAYLGRDSQLDVTVPAKNLPATVQLRAEPDTFLAEAAWSSLRFLTSIFTGVQGKELDPLIEKLLDGPDTVDCLHSALNIGQGETPSMGEVLGLVASSCTQTIVDGVGVYASSKSAWDKFWGRFFAIGEGAATAWNTFTTAADGIKMQFVGTVSVVVDNTTSARSLIKPMVGTWQYRTQLLRINANATGSLSVWCDGKSGFPMETRAQLEFKISGGSLVGVYGNVSYNFPEGPQTTCTRMTPPVSEGGSFPVSLLSAKLLSYGSEGTRWCRSDASDAYKRETCQVM